jgi:hypothetical protein
MEKDRMKIQRMHPGILIILLGATSFFGVLLLPKIKVLFRDPVGLGGAIISLVLILVLCAISARIILWAYSQVQVPLHPRQIFVFGFFISAISVIINMEWRALQQQYFLERMKGQLEDIPFVPGYPNFLSIGFGPVLITCATATISLLWIARWKKNKDGSAGLLVSAYRRHDILLIVSTVVVYIFIMKLLLEFIMYTITVLGSGFIR